MNWIPDPPEWVESRWQVFKTTALDLSIGFVPRATGAMALVLGALAVATNALTAKALFELLLFTLFTAAVTLLLCLSYAAYFALLLYRKKQ